MKKKQYENVYQFKVTLKNIKPPIWRRIQVPETYSFWDLHVAIQSAMCWMDYHLHEFTVADPKSGKWVRIGLPDAEFESMDTILPEDKQCIADWFFVGGKPATYMYDFGDDWVHTMKLEKIIPREKAFDYPRCTGGKRACPPEDCGGPWGYMELLEVLANPEGEEYEEMLEWVGEDFDPERFHRDAVFFSDPAKRWRQAYPAAGAITSGQKKTVMAEGGGEEREDLPELDLLDRIRSQPASLANFEEELEALLPYSILTSAAKVDIALKKQGEGEMTPEEVEKVIREQTDLHPLHPFLFEICQSYAIARMDELEILGYTALTMLKSERMMALSPEGYAEEIPDAFKGLQELVEKNEELLTVFPYLEEGGDHLVNHFLIEDILTCELEIKEEELRLVLERGEQIVPILIAACRDMMSEMDGDSLPVEFDYLLRLIGHFKPIEALPALMLALEECCGQPLHETVLALAKLGSDYPEEVSAELRDLAGNVEYGESRLAAIETIGILGGFPGNTEFLREALEKLDPNDPDYIDMFIFLIQALASSGHDKKVEMISAALEKHRPFFTPGGWAFFDDFVGNQSFSLSCRLEDLLEEDICDLRELELDDEVHDRRATMTQAREEALEEAEEDQLPDLPWVEEQLRTGGDEPCPCGSGVTLKKCCLPRLEELRDILMDAEKIE